MSYAVIAVTDGNFNIHSEHGDNLEAAKFKWHEYSMALINDSETREAMIKICDQNLDLVDHYMEYINKDLQDAQAEPDNDDDI